MIQTLEESGYNVFIYPTDDGCCELEFTFAVVFEITLILSVNSTTLFLMDATCVDGSLDFERVLSITTTAEEILTLLGTHLGDVGLKR